MRNKIIVMTSTNITHKFFVNSLAENFDVLGVISEKKPIQINQDDGRQKEHFELRSKKEVEFFGNHKIFNTTHVKEIQRGESNNPEIFEWLKELNPDYIILFGTSIIKEPILSYFDKRIINMHLGLSPYYRGVGTNFWPLTFREPECVGVTIHLALLKVDAGNILLQGRPNISIGDDCHDIGCKTLQIGVELMIKVINDYPNKITSVKQESRGQLFKNKDFNSKAIARMKRHFNNGMIKEYIDNKNSRDEKYPIKND